jgi:hypothetical protein
MNQTITRLSIFIPLIGIFFSYKYNYKLFILSLLNTILILAYFGFGLFGYNINNNIIYNLSILYIFMLPLIASYTLLKN